MPEMPDNPSLTVIIPTYNRVELLAKALAGYEKQSSPELIEELLVVDDGSTDGTAAFVRTFCGETRLPVRYVKQSNKGPAAARNLGLSEAKSRLVLFTDSDIIPSHDLVEQHSVWHRKHPAIHSAVLGYVTWSPEVNPTPFMRWYGEDAMLFAYRAARGRTELDYRFFYTCNVSVKTAFLREYGHFNESFRSAAYEDTELGYRLSKHGMTLRYNSAAVGYHHQFFSFAAACRKARANANAAQLFFQTEAGQEVLKQIERKRSRLSYRIAKTCAKGAVMLLHPIRSWIDSRTRLPGLFYHLFFWYDVNGFGKVASER
jgi:glycosyltransferase involved in cell wall biosynthesis